MFWCHGQHELLWINDGAFSIFKAVFTKPKYECLEAIGHGTANCVMVWSIHFFGLIEFCARENIEQASGDLGGLRALSTASVLVAFFEFCILGVIGDRTVLLL
jgi:hypothetical protein